MTFGFKRIVFEPAVLTIRTTYEHHSLSFSSSLLWVGSFTYHHYGCTVVLHNFHDPIMTFIPAHSFYLAKRRGVLKNS